MINLLPEPKQIIEIGGFTKLFDRLSLGQSDNSQNQQELLELMRLRFWNYAELPIMQGKDGSGEGFTVKLLSSLEGIAADKLELFREQGYDLEIKEEEALLRFENKEGFINGVTSLKLLLKEDENGYFKLPLCHITDYPSLPVRAIAPTFSWYAGYGRIGFDSQLWGYEEWVQYLNICLDNKINQFNLLMYGYWPFELPGCEGSRLRRQEEGDAAGYRYPDRRYRDQLRLRV